MITGEQLRKNKVILWFLKDQKIKGDDSFLDRFWKYQWNYKELIVIVSGCLYLVFDWLGFDIGKI